MNYICLLDSSWCEGWRWLSHTCPVMHTACSPLQSQATLSDTKTKPGWQTADDYKSYPAELLIRFIALLGLASCLIVEAVVADEAGTGRRWGRGGSAGEGEEERDQEEE